jgi:O-succinylbenzoate synthase
VEAAEHVIRHHLLPRLFALSEVRPQDVDHALKPVRGHPMAKAALETAVLDAELRMHGQPLSEFLGGIHQSVRVGVSVGIADDISRLLDTVSGYLDDGYERVKLKIEPGWDYEPVRAVRERFGDNLLLQVDANAAYQLSDARQLAKLDAFDLLLIEQPLPEDEVLAHAKLSALLKTPVCLDESITSARAASDAIAMGACSIINIKPGRVGGYLEARRIHDICQAAGVPVWHGGMLETGVGRAANLALASLPNFTLPGDISASDRYFHRDITSPFVLETGRIRVPEGPGIGVNVLADELEEFTTSTEYLTPS